MIEKSRTEYSVLNTTVSMASRIITILMGFVTRVIFTRMLGQSYVGISGLFVEIINVLSFSELGIGTAISYALYKPIAENDVEKQKSLMCLYRRLYQVIAGIILTAGLLVIPFMDILIKNQQKIDHLILIYLLYLFNSAGSYLFAYKKTIIDTHQKSYITILYYAGFIMIQYVLQIIVLLTTRNFILYLLVYLFCTLGNNIAVSVRAGKMYPYIKDKNVIRIEKEDKKGILKNVKALMTYKLGNVAINNTDNILLSAIMGIEKVACYSNYYLIIGSAKQVLNQMLRGITASVGNLGVLESCEKIRKVFEVSFFIGFWLYGFSSICLFEVLNIFVEFSFGKEYVFSENIVFVLCLNFYLTGMRQVTLVFRESLGLFWYDRYRSIIEAVVNLIVSIILALRFGTIGIFIGTFISMVAVSVWIEPLILYKYRIKSSVKTYFKRYAAYTTLMFIVGGITHVLCESHGFFVRFLICTIVPNILIGIIMYKTEEFQYLKDMLLQMIGRRFKWIQLKNS